VTNQEIIERIDRTIAEEFEIDPEGMKPEKTLFQDLGLDSLDIVDLVIVLEKAFGFKIREEEGIRNIRTLGDVHAFVLRKKNELESIPR
jgi:acyl carrier protein